MSLTEAQLAELERGLKPFVDMDGDCLCNRCQNHFTLRGKEPTAFCNDCAHAVIEEHAPALIAAAREADELREAIKALAKNLASFAKWTDDERGSPGSQPINMIGDVVKDNEIASAAVRAALEAAR